MKLGILGTGMIVHMAMPSLNRLDIEKKAILSTPRSAAKAQEMADANGIEKVYTDYDELLQADVDTIYVGLPNVMHYEYTKKALEAGKHVILEKPATSNPEELEELMDIARQKDLILVEAVTVHYLPAFKALKEHLPDIGPLRIFTFNYSQYSSRYDKFQEGIIAPAFDPAKAGGAFVDINLYNVNGIFGLFGVPEFMNYYANIQRGIDTSGIAVYGYEGFLGTGVGAKDCQAPLLNTIQGEKGSIWFTGSVSSLSRFTVEMNDGTKTEYDFTEDKDRMTYEFEVFSDWINTHNKAAADETLQLSLEINKAMTRARRQAGVLYPGEEA